MQHDRCDHGIRRGEHFPPPSLSYNVVDYYDGIVTATASCSHCGERLRIVMLDRNTTATRKVFAIGPITDRLYEQARLLPTPTASMAMSQEELTEVYAQFEIVNEELTLPIRPEVVLAYDDISKLVLEDRIGTSYPIPTGQPLASIFDKPETDWFDLLGQDRAE